MLKKIRNYILKRYRIGSDEEMQKFIALFLIGVIGFVFALQLFVRNLIESQSAGSIPGDIALLVFFSLILYILQFGKIKWAVNTIFILPIVSYYFYISRAFAIYPVSDATSNTLYCLLPGFFFLLIFAEKLYKLLIYFVLALSTLSYHLWIAGKIRPAFLFQWPDEEQFTNPLPILLIVFLFTLLTFLFYRNIIRSLKQQAESTQEQMKKATKSMLQAMMITEIEFDEFETASGLRIKMINPAFESAFKLPQRELAGKDASLMFPRLFRGAFDWEEVYLRSKKNKFEFYAEHLDRWFEVYLVRPGGKQIISLFYDVSTRQKSIDQLKESRKRFQVLLEAIPDMFFLIDKDGIYVDFVLKENENVRIDPNEIIGNSIYEVGFSEKMSRKIYQCIQDCLRFDSIETIEYALEVEKGTAMFEMRIAKLNDDTVISIARDITKRKVAEIKLEEAKNRAEESDRLKSAFLANISHEIRTPMNAIIGFSKMVGSPDFSIEEKNKFLDIIISNGKMLMTLINDMISLSKIESNQVEVIKSNCMVNDLLVLLYKDYMNEMSEFPQVSLKLRNENANPKFSIYTDYNLLKEVLEKLIDNAIKFTNKGTVEFGYRTLPEGLIEFFVKDSGIGIAEEDLDRIFARFHQLDNRTTRNYGGTGLGLPIAQHFVSLLGGKLKVNSRLGEGSIFYFSLPAENPAGHLKIIR